MTEPIQSTHSMNIPDVVPVKGTAAELGPRLMALAGMDYPRLRMEWRRAFRADPPGKVGRDLLELGIAWKLQERVHGGLGSGTRRRLAELNQVMAEKGDLAKARTTRLKPGARLMREWGGVTHDVLVLEDGFSWQDRHWRSLSAIAVAITGAHWSGPRFFGLTGKTKPQETADG